MIKLLRARSFYFCHGSRYLDGPKLLLHFFFFLIYRLTYKYTAVIVYIRRTTDDNGGPRVRELGGSAIFQRPFFRVNNLEQIVTLVQLLMKTFE